MWGLIGFWLCFFFGKMCYVIRDFLLVFFPPVIRITFELIFVFRKVMEHRWSCALVLWTEQGESCCSPGTPAGEQQRHCCGSLILVECHFWFCFCWNAWCGTLAAKKIHTLVSPHLSLRCIGRRKHRHPVINQKHWLLAVKILKCLDFTLLCQYSPVYEWEKNDRKQLERCQWVGVHDLWRHFHPSYFVLQALNRLLASAHQWRLLNNSGLECLSPVSLT